MKVNKANNDTQMINYALNSHSEVGDVGSCWDLKRENGLRRRAVSV